MLPRGQLRLGGFDELSEIDPDRDTWTTPPIITDAIGEVDLDPCSNERSTVRARRVFRLDKGQDGLVLAKFVGRGERVFVNPPYSRGMVIQWVRAYEHTRFIFLVRMDTSTGWFSELMARTEEIAVLREARTNFVPPPGVKGESNAFPHGLFYAKAEDVTDAIKAICYRWRPVR